MTALRQLDPDDIAGPQRLGGRADKAVVRRIARRAARRPDMLSSGSSSVCGPTCTVDPPERTAVTSARYSVSSCNGPA